MSISGRIVFILIIIALMVIIFAAGAYTPPDFSAPATPPPPSTVYMPEEPDPVYTDLGAPCVIEYGIPNAIISNNDPLHAYIRYPQAGNQADIPIHQWALKLFEDISVGYNTGVEFSLADFGEINIHFDSYLIDNRYAGIHQYGQYSLDSASPPVEVLKTFNIDLTAFEIIEPSDIFDLEDPEGLLQLLRLRLLVEHPSTDGYTDFIDESWLKYLLITHEGIKVFLPRSEFLPDKFESLTVMLPYGDLGSALLIRRDAPLPSMPVPTPIPTPEPPPSEPDGEGDEDDPDDEGEDGDPDREGEAGDPDGEDGEPDGEEGNPDGEEGTDGTDEAEDGEGEDGVPDGEQIEEPPAEIPVQGSIINTEGLLIALSFDDGPGTYTQELLEILEQHGVRATFFAVGNLAWTEESALKYAASIGCEVAGQSWNHKNLAKMNAYDVSLQIETTQAAIEEITGITVPFFRPPYGAVSDTMKEVSEELGLSMIKWNADPEDWKYQDADYIYDRIMEQVSDRAIILGHDVYESTIEAYRRAIPELLLQGYQIVTVSELLRYTYKELTPGVVYYSGVFTEVLT